MKTNLLIILVASTACAHAADPFAAMDRRAMVRSMNAMAPPRYPGGMSSMSGGLPQYRPSIARSDAPAVAPMPGSPLAIKAAKEKAKAAQDAYAAQVDAAWRAKVADPVFQAETARRVREFWAERATNSPSKN